MFRFISLSGLAALAAAFIAIGCGNDTPTDSPPVVNDYELVLNSTYNPDADSSRFLLVISAGNDSVIDSSYVDYAFQDLVFSADGMILYRTRVGLNPFPEPLVWATDWKAEDTLALYEGAGGGDLAIDDTDHYLFLNNNWYPTIFSLPDLQPVFIDSSHGSSGGVFIPGRPQAVYYTFAETRITFIDYSSTPPVTQVRPIEDTAGNPVNVQAIGVSASGDSLLLIGSVNWQRWYFLIASTDSRDILTQFDIPPHLMYDCTPIILRPHSNEALFYYPGNLYDGMNFGNMQSSDQEISGSFYRVNIQTGDWSVLLDENAFGFFFIRDLLMTPDGRYGYVVTYSRLIKIDLGSGEKSQVLLDRLLAGLSITIKS